MGGALGSFDKNLKRYCFCFQRLFTFLSAVSGHQARWPRFQSAKNKLVLIIISILYLICFVIIHNFTKGHNISVPSCAPLLLSTISFSVINSVCY